MSVPQVFGNITTANTALPSTGTIVAGSMVSSAPAPAGSLVVTISGYWFGSVHFYYFSGGSFHQILDTQVYNEAGASGAIPNHVNGVYMVTGAPSGLIYLGASAWTSGTLTVSEFVSSSISLPTSSLTLPFTDSRYMNGGNTVVDPATFGAVGDGTADDTNALQSALTSIGMAGGGTLQLRPNTTYYYTSVLAISPYTNIRGFGINSALVGPGLSCLYLINQVQSTFIGLFDLGLKGGAFDGATAPNRGLDLQGAAGVVIERVYFFGYHFQIVAVQCERIYINSTWHHATSNTSVGLWLPCIADNADSGLGTQTNPPTSSLVQVVNSEFDWSQTDDGMGHKGVVGCPIVADEGLEYLFDGVEVTGGQFALHLGNVSNVTIRNCDFETQADYSISIDTKSFVSPTHAFTSLAGAVTIGPSNYFGLQVDLSNAGTLIDIGNSFSIPSKSVYVNTSLAGSAFSLGSSNNSPGGTMFDGSPTGNFFCYDRTALLTVQSSIVSNSQSTNIPQYVPQFCVSTLPPNHPSPMPPAFGTNYGYAIDYQGRAVINSVGGPNAGLATMFAGIQQQTLDDGFGNMTVKGAYTSTSPSTTSPQFGVSAPPSGAGSFGTNYGYAVDNSGRAVTNNATGKGAVTMAAGTVQQTLDDGSGNMAVKGAYTSTSPSTTIPQFGVSAPPSGAGSFGTNYGYAVDNSGRAVINNASTKGLVTMAGASVVQQTLDDGSGNMTIKGGYTSTSPSTSHPQFGVSTLPSAAPTFGTNYGYAIDTNGRAIANNASGQGAVTMAAGTVQQTLDDGSGNMSVKGGYTSNSTSTSHPQFGVSTPPSGASSFGANYGYGLDNSGRAVINHGSGKGAVTTSSGSVQQVLDDGFGDMTIKGGYASNFKNETSSYSATGNDSVIVYSGGVAATVTLPAPGGTSGIPSGRIFIVKNMASAMVNVDVKMGSTILKTLAQGAGSLFVSDITVATPTWYPIP